MELADGDFLDIDWGPEQPGPLVLILHGMEGSSESGYVCGLLGAVAARGWQGVAMQFRNCGGEPNRLASSYCAGFTEDLAYVVELLQRRFPQRPLTAVGYSLGGNLLLKWLGEQGAQGPLAAAVAVSVPFLLEHAARRLTQGASRIYQRYLLDCCKVSYRRKFATRDDAPVALERLGELRDFYQFDDRITAPLHGYDGVADYYARASSRPFLRAVETPTLILHARDDPFLLPQAIPAEHELGPRMTLELSERGGHVGFVEGNLPGRARYWLERRIPTFLNDYLTRSST